MSETMKDKFKKRISSALFMQIDKSSAYDQAAQSCSDLCDQFAIDAMEWAGKLGYDYFDGYGWKRPLQIEECIPTKQLLELFKNRDNG